MISFQAQILRLYMRIKRHLAGHFRELDVQKERRDIEALARMFKPLTPIQCTRVSAGDRPADWIVPAGSLEERVILYLHGGSFISGSPTSHRSLAANIAAAGRARALLLDHRLAPEHPFPSALQDALAAYEWLLSSGTPAAQIVLAGDSAGGTLVLTLLIQLRDQGRPLPARAVCLSPVTDMSLSGESWMHNARKDVMLESRKLGAAIQLYLQGTDPYTPLASPLYADLNGLPPLLIQVGSEEVLLSDATRLTAKAQDAGAPVTLEVWDGMQHEWQFAASLLPEGKQAIARIGEFMVG